MLQQPVRMKHEHAQLAQRRWGELKTERARHEQMWEAIARLIRPQRGGFGLDDPAGRVLEKPLSSAPIMAQVNFSSGLYGALTNPASRWFALTTPDEELNRWHPFALWRDKCAARIFASFSPSNSPFYSQTHMCFADVATFGNAAQYDEIDMQERKILDVTVSLSEIVYAIDGYGRVCETVRRFLLTPSQAVKMFGVDAVPPKIVDLARQHSTDKHAYFHHVGRNDMFQPGRLGARGKAWFSRYATEVEDALLRESGYDEMPFHAPRWEVETGATYGTGPAFNALASARTHNAMEGATIRAAQFAADPAKLAPDRQAWPLQGRIAPGQVVYGAMNMRGDVMLRNMEAPRDIGLTFEEKNAKLAEIKDAFHYSLMNLAGRTGMTATEVMTINEERQRLWAPHMGRLQEEFLAPKIQRRFQLLWKAGQLPPPPDGVPDDTPLEIQYTSAAALAQRSADGAAALRVIQDVVPLAQLKPRMLDRISEDDLLEVLVAARGAPQVLLRSREEADQLAEQRAQAEQQAQAMQMMQAGAGAAKDMAGAMGAMGGMEGVM